MTPLAYLLGFGRIKITDDSAAIQTMQIDQGPIAPDNGRRLIDKVRRVIEYGFTSNPPLESEAIMARYGADRSLSIVIGTNHQASRPRDLQPGDVSLYDMRGAHVLFTANGIEIDGAGLPLIIRNAPTVTIIAETKVRIESPLVEVTGDVVSRADGEAVSLNALHDAYNAHAHGGVQGGAGTTATTDHPA